MYPPVCLWHRQLQSGHNLFFYMNSGMDLMKDLAFYLRFYIMPEE